MPSMSGAALDLPAETSAGVHQQPGDLREHVRLHGVLEPPADGALDAVVDLAPQRLASHRTPPASWACTTDPVPGCLVTAVPRLAH